MFGCLHLYFPCQKSVRSKYFKPGYIFNRSEGKADDTDFGDDLDDDYYEEAISQASQKVVQPSISSPSKSAATSIKPDALARIDQIASQAVDFNSKAGSAHIPSLRGNNTILGTYSLLLP